MHTLLSQHQLAPDGGSAFFQWVCLSKANYVFEKLAFQGILTRLFSDPPSLRFGLPAMGARWQRLDRALTQI